MSFIFTCGFDEAGRGPLAGPVTAGAVILPADFPAGILNDSKKLSEKKRIEAEKIIKEQACFGIGIVGHETIDEINILKASMLAMKEAYEAMVLKLPEWASKNGFSVPEENIHSVITAVADGTSCPDVPCDVRAEVKADGKYFEVMAASILAKVCRDRIMEEYDALYPEYKYARHKGYPTKMHREICREIGPSPIQRLSFKY